MVFSTDELVRFKDNENYYALFEHGVNRSRIQTIILKFAVEFYNNPYFAQ